MIDVLEKAIAELATLAMACGTPFGGDTEAWASRLGVVRDSLRALVEAQKSAKPTDAAERLATLVERDVALHLPQAIRALGREHAAEIARWEAQSIAVNDAGLQLDKELAAERDELRRFWTAAKQQAETAERRCERWAAEVDRQIARVAEVIGWNDEGRRERDAARVEAKRLKEALLALDAARLSERTRPKEPDHCARCRAATLVFDELQRIKTALTDKGSVADPASGSQGASSAQPAPEPASSAESGWPAGVARAFTRLDALVAELAKTDAVVRAHVESMPPQTRAVVDAMRAKGWKP